jgi:hypothetical protein
MPDFFRANPSQKNVRPTILPLTTFLFESAVNNQVKHQDQDPSDFIATNQQHCLTVVSSGQIFSNRVRHQKASSPSVRCVASRRPKQNKIQCLIDPACNGVTHTIAATQINLHPLRPQTRQLVCNRTGKPFGILTASVIPRCVHKGRGSLNAA